MQTDLMQEIEDVRRNLNAFVSAESLVALDVVQLSERLDCLIIQYYRNSKLNSGILSL